MTMFALRRLAPLTLLLLATPAAAQFPWEDEGELTLHDDPDTEAVEDIADCTFWVRGVGFDLANGTVDVYENHGRGGLDLILREPFETDDDGSFLAGPITLTGEHENAGRIYVEVVTEGTRGEFSDPEAHVWTVGEVHCGRPYIPCIDDLAAEALPKGDVRLTWGAAANASYYHVYRSHEDHPNGRPDFEHLGNVTATTFLDTTAEPGVTYLYEITASDGALLHADSCPRIVVTAVPFFGAPLLGAVGLVAVVGAYAWLRRK